MRPNKATARVGIEWITMAKVYLNRAMTWGVILTFLVNVINLILLYYIANKWAMPLPVGVVIGASIVIIIAGAIVFGYLDYKYLTGQRENNANFDLSPRMVDMYKAVHSTEERTKRIEEEMGRKDAAIRALVDENARLRRCGGSEIREMSGSMERP